MVAPVESVPDAPEIGRAISLRAPMEDRERNVVSCGTK
jgi:hypothetical protein